MAHRLLLRRATTIHQLSTASAPTHYKSCLKAGEIQRNFTNASTRDIIWKVQCQQVQSCTALFDQQRSYALHTIHRNENNIDCPPLPTKAAARQDTGYVNVKLGSQLKTDKRLPPIPTSNCECVEPEPLRTIALKPLPRVSVAEPKKICPKSLCRQPQPPPVVPKVLPKIGVSNCPCINPEPLRDVELKRLPKKRVPEPPKVCIKEMCGRKDPARFSVKPKTLPKIGVSNCPCVEPTPLKDFDFKRLPKRHVPEPPKVCPKPVCKATPQPVVKPKTLPKIGFSNCPCIDPEPLRSIDLKPLPKKSVAEPPKICPKSRCMPRPQPPIIPRELPKMPVSNCPCVEPEIPSHCPPIVRLPKCPEVDPPKCTKLDKCAGMPRADRDDWTYSVRRQYSTSTNSNYNLSRAANGGITGNNQKRTFTTNSFTLANQLTTSNTRPFMEPNFALKRRFSFDTLSCNKELQITDYNNAGDHLSKHTTSEMVTTENARKISSICKVEKKNVSSAGNKRTVFGMVLKYLMMGQRPSVASIDRVPLVCRPVRSPKDRHYFSTLNSMEMLSAPANPVVAQEASCDDAEITPMVLNVANHIPVAIDGQNLHQQNQRNVANEQITKSLHYLMADSRSCKSSGDQRKYQNSMWQKVVNYFMARPCPSPAEFKMMRLRKEAKIAAKRAQLCVYDPKELEQKQRKHLPKVITARPNSNDQC